MFTLSTLANGPGAMFNRARNKSHWKRPIDVGKRGLGVKSLSKNNLKKLYYKLKFLSFFF